MRSGLESVFIVLMMVVCGIGMLIATEAMAQRARQQQPVQAKQTCGIEGTNARHEEIAPDLARPKIDKAQAREVLRKEKTTRALLAFANHYALPIEKYPDGGYPALMFEVGGVTVHITHNGQMPFFIAHEVPEFTTAQWEAVIAYPMCETLHITCEPACASVYWEASGGQFYGLFQTESGETVADGCSAYVDPPEHCFGLAAPIGQGVTSGELAGARLYGNFVIEVSE